MAGAQLSVVQGLLSLQNASGSTALPLHAPKPQTSPLVHALPSSHGRLLLVNTQPLPGLQLSDVQMLLSLQVVATPAHSVAAHLSPLVHALPSSQLVVLAVCVQPVRTLQASVVQVLLSLHAVSGSSAVPEQVPAVHLSPVVHALPSVQGSEFGVLAHPVVGLQESSVQALLSLQLTATPAQAPPLQMSPEVHALPSEHTAVLAVLTQAPDATLQLSFVQPLLSLQLRTAPGTHALPLQTSPTVHGLPSVHGETFATCAQPVNGLQESSVQALLSSQLTSGPGKHTPPVHASPTEHTLLSALHGDPWFCAT